MSEFSSSVASSSSNPPWPSDLNQATLSYLSTARYTLVSADNYFYIRRCVCLVTLQPWLLTQDHGCGIWTRWPTGVKSYIGWLRTVTCSARDLVSDSRPRRWKVRRWSKDGIAGRQNMMWIRGKGSCFNGSGFWPRPLLEWLFAKTLECDSFFFLRRWG